MLLQILANFLQATAVAALINVEWTRSVVGLLAFPGTLNTIDHKFLCFLDLASKASIESVSNPIYCLTQKNQSIRSVLASLLVPFLLVIPFVAFFIFKAVMKHKGIGFIVKRGVLSSYTIFYFTYLALTRQSVLILSCGRFRINRKQERQHYRSFFQYDAFGAQDTSIEFHSNNHDFVKAWASIVLVIFTLGFPIVIGVLIVYITM